MSTPEPTDLPQDAYALLSKPTLELSDKEIEAICADLRKRRERFLAGQKDTAPKKPAAKKAPLTDEAKQQAAAEILDGIGDLF